MHPAEQVNGFPHFVGLQVADEMPLCGVGAQGDLETGLLDFAFSEQRDPASDSGGNLFWGPGLGGSHEPDFFGSTLGELSGIGYAMEEERAAIFEGCHKMIIFEG
jgi:hypothetical protein